MIIGVPKEIKVLEHRVGLTPQSVAEFINHGHSVIIETMAGNGIGCSDEDYKAVGASVASSAEEVFLAAEMIVKVKEPQASERKLLREGQILYTYLHLAPDPEQTKDLVDSGATCIAYETVTSPTGGLPLLAPMSKVAGRLSVQAGAHCLEQPQGGQGKLLGGVPGVAPCKVMIIGGGMVGSHAAQIAVGMGADVWIFDNNPLTLEQHWQQFGRTTNAIYSTHNALEQHVLDADLIIGGVLIPGAGAPKLITKEMITSMKAGSVVVDVAIDQGGCFATSHATTHSEPTFVVDDVIHYCVANMPGAVPLTSTYALNNVTLPFGLAIANKGVKQALLDNPHLMNGLNVCKGQVTYKSVADELGYDYADPKTVL